MSHRMEIFQCFRASSSSSMFLLSVLTGLMFSASSAEAQGVSKQKIPSFVTFPSPCLDTESVINPHTQFLLPFPLGLPKMIPALSEVPFHSFFHGRIPVRWPGHGTCRSLKLFLICPGLRRKWSLEKLSLRWICVPFNYSHSFCHPAKSWHPMKGEWNSALRALLLRMKNRTE